jgi:hypothetical protein
MKLVLAALLLCSCSEIDRALDDFDGARPPKGAVLLDTIPGSIYNGYSWVVWKIKGECFLSRDNRDLTNTTWVPCKNFEKDK